MEELGFARVWESVEWKELEGSENLNEVEVEV